MYWLDENDAQVDNSQKAFFADDVSDIENLPTAKSWGAEQDYRYSNPDIKYNYPVQYGSTCFVIATADVYMLNSKNIWTKVGG